MSPSPVRTTLSGKICALLTCCRTTTVANADCTPLDAVTSASPFVTARTSPRASTVATLGSLVAQVTVGFGIGCAALSLAIAAMRLVSAIATMVSRPGATNRNAIV